MSNATEGVQPAADKASSCGENAEAARFRPHFQALERRASSLIVAGRQRAARGSELALQGTGHARPRSAGSQRLTPSVAGIGWRWAGTRRRALLANASHSGIPSAEVREPRDRLSGSCALALQVARALSPQSFHHVEVEASSIASASLEASSRIRSRSSTSSGAAASRMWRSSNSSVRAPDLPVGRQRAGSRKETIVLLPSGRHTS